MASSLYLGDSQMPANLRWVPEGCGHMLSCIAVPAVSGTATPTDEDEGPAPDRPANLPPASPPEHAVLSAIVRIDREDFWLVSDGGYQGPGNVWKDILDVKLSCALTKPSLEPINSDFAVVLNALRLLTQKCVTPGYTLGKSLFGNENSNPTRFKLRHKLLESLDTSVDSDDVGPPAATGPSLLLRALAAHPFAYRRLLQGAVVEIHFTLSHWGIAGVRRDVYGGDIELIRLLDAPIVSTCAGIKRRLPLHLKADSVPSKKQVTG
ncbi:hypothetical protein EDD15DRAFT_2377090 [Pisolithus albus]|nr:hypothetical protein EDD15DRAFT_2377090 [Pisolithus albus]